MSIVIERFSKTYDNHPVVDQVSLEIADGELFVLLGPSGSGKSTILRMIAGLIEADVGRLLLQGRDVTQLPPQKRGIGFVFQHYALFAHLTVRENVAFPLRIRRVKAEERRNRCSELLEMVGLMGFEDRFPQQLSGGQQQRVALARALAHRPEVLLLDEPFGALDARIRTELRRTVRRIQRELRITTVFVTHDQDEAFEMADRMGVMNFGRLLEVGPPRELYLRPQTEFVATFLGKANLMVGECMPEGVHLGPLRFPLSTRAADFGTNRRVLVLFRPEDVAVKVTAEALRWPLLGQAVVEEVGFVGASERLRLRLPQLPGVRPVSPAGSFGDDNVRIEAARSQHLARRFPLKAGETAWVGVRRIHALTHPGLSLLLVAGSSPAARAALALGAQIARLSHARVALLGQGQEGQAGGDVQVAREILGSGPPSLDVRTSPDAVETALAREAARERFDLVIHGLPGPDVVKTASRILRAVEHHVLLVPAACQVPTSVLICVAVGEPGKLDVLVAGRLAKHVGARATILTVVAAPQGEQSVGKAGRFLAAGLRTLTLLGVEGQTVIRHGSSEEEILQEVGKGKYDLVVLGAPFGGRHGDHALGGVTARVLADLGNVPALIVRSERESAGMD